MPSVSKGSKVLVSGANGYIAMWVGRTLLERGFSVRGTVRTEEKGKFMIEYFKSLGYGDKFEVVVVDDIVKVGKLVPFDHTSELILKLRKEHLTRQSKVSMQLSIRPRHSVSIPVIPKVRKDFTMIRSTPSVYSTFYEVELIQPAVQGTLGILKSALKNGYASLPYR